MSNQNPHYHCNLCNVEIRFASQHRIDLHNATDAHKWNEIRITTVSKVLEFASEREIQVWANTTSMTKHDQIIQICHFDTKIYHYFVHLKSRWTLAMTSINPYW